MAKVDYALLQSFITMPTAASFSAEGGNNAKVHMAIKKLLTEIADLWKDQDSEVYCQALQLLVEEALKLRNYIRELTST